MDEKKTLNEEESEALEADSEEVKDTNEKEASKTDSSKGDNLKGSKKNKKIEADLKEALAAIEKKDAEIKESNDKYMRMIAEYDNFRRRTAKEKENIYADAYEDAMKVVLPILDNVERAAMYSDGEAVAKGVQMISKSFKDALAKLGIVEIECFKDGKGLPFNPEFHNAVMHIEDENYGESEIVEVLQKGYVKGDRVIRYAMVKVAN